MNLLVAMFADAITAHRTLGLLQTKITPTLESQPSGSKLIAATPRGSLSKANASFSNLFQGVDDNRVLMNSSFQRSGKGYTWRALTNVINEVDTGVKVFAEAKDDSHAKRKWKLASRVVLERQKLMNRSKKNVLDSSRTQEQGDQSSMDVKDVNEALREEFGIRQVLDDDEKLDHDESTPAHLIKIEHLVDEKDGYELSIIHAEEHELEPVLVGTIGTLELHEETNNLQETSESEEIQFEIKH
jgi:hypothetical protein